MLCASCRESGVAVVLAHNRKGRQPDISNPTGASAKGFDPKDSRRATSRHTS